MSYLIALIALLFIGWGLGTFITQTFEGIRFLPPLEPFEAEPFVVIEPCDEALELYMGDLTENIWETDPIDFGEPREPTRRAD